MGDFFAYQFKAIDKCCFGGNSDQQRLFPVPVAWPEERSEETVGSVCARLKRFLKDRLDVHNPPIGRVLYKLMDPAERAR